METLTINRTWASAHEGWQQACEHAYSQVRGSMLPEERAASSITPLEFQGRETVHGREVAVWSVFAHTPSGVVLRYDVLDEIARRAS